MWIPDDGLAYKEAYLNGATNDELIKLAGEDATLNKVLRYNKIQQDAGELPCRNTKHTPEPVKPVNPMKRYNDFWRLDGKDGFMIAGDFHAPFYSTLWLKRVIEMAKRLNVRRLIIGGDGLDLSSFSGWGPNTELNWDKEAQAAAAWLWELYHFFDEIWWLKGNHCKRVTRKTDGQLQFPDLVRAILLRYADEHGIEFTYCPNKLNFTMFPFCEIDGEWRVVHPKQYSKIPLRVPNNLALKYRKHVIALHGHHAAIGWCNDGQHIVAECGGGFDEETVEYVSTEMTDHPAWNPGFMIYRNGCVQLLCEQPFTDWSDID